MPDIKNTQGARALAWTGIGLGLAEIAVPRWISEQLGVEDHSTLLRTLGAREILAGVIVLSEPDAPSGMWARVAGDVMDVALLGIAAERSTRKGGVAVAAAMVLGISALDLVFARRLHESH